MLNLDPLEFRLRFVRDKRVRAVLDKVAAEGNWGRSMPAGTAQGIAMHKEYRATPRASSRSTAGPRRSTARSASRHRAAGDQGARRVDAA